MPYTAEQTAEFRSQFKVRRKRQLLLLIAGVPIIFAAVTAQNGISLESFGVSTTFVFYAFAVFVVCIVIFSFKNWRCPACQGYLGRGNNPRFCPKCGIGFRDDVTPHI